MAPLASFIITTTQDPRPSIYHRACELSDRMNVPFVERKRHSIEFLHTFYHTEQVVVFTHQGPVIHTASGKYFFHLSMAELRIQNLKVGKHDHMIQAMNLQPGMSVLDCTLGLATDAIVASFVTGSAGQVTGLESSAAIALITRLGLAEHTHVMPDVTSALRRIKVIEADSSMYLKSLPNDSYDIIYFDPMFRQPVFTSSNMKPIRTLADTRPLTAATIKEACRVARSRVILKEKRNSGEFARLNFTSFVGGKHSTIQYGIMEAKSWNG